MASNNSKPAGSTAGLIFGIFMVIVYIGVGILCILNVDHDILSFNNPGISLALGILLIIYGIWRAYRLWRSRQ
ncbi:MAG: hypothetical protein K2M14_02600 [Muribaculaceae bacterium]|nr:hypothetical protein [Bacteroidales bacterium]MDE6242881.1 hypothetical protein [Muribaculaceae bacterium]